MFVFIISMLFNYKDNLQLILLTQLIIELVEQLLLRY